MLPPELVEMIKAGGAAMAPIFAMLWWLERGERIDSQKELKQIARDQTIAATSMEKTIGQWASLFRSPGSNQ
jgi:hypothetical protein